jgi:hypothetical protein
MSGSSGIFYFVASLQTAYKDWKWQVFQPYISGLGTQAGLAQSHKAIVSLRSKPLTKIGSSKVFQPYISGLSAQAGLAQSYKAILSLRPKPLAKIGSGKLFSPASSGRHGSRWPLLHTTTTASLTSIISSPVPIRFSSMRDQAC